MQKRVPISNEKAGRQGSSISSGKRVMILDRVISVGGKSSRYAAWGAVLLTLLHLCWLQLQPGSGLRETWADAVKSPAPASRKVAAEKESFEQIGRQTGTGNLLLHFAVSTKAACYIYFLSSYVLYPRRLYVGPADSVVNNLEDLMRIEFNPGREWLQERDVRCVLTFVKDGTPLQAHFLQPPDASAGAQTNRPGGN